jgi:hypothetical protein
MFERTPGEVQDQIDEAADSMAEGGSRWPGMSYEEGVLAALRWLVGESFQKPMEDE